MKSLINKLINFNFYERIKKYYFYKIKINKYFKILFNINDLIKRKEYYYLLKKKLNKKYKLYLNNLYLDGYCKNIDDIIDNSLKNELFNRVDNIYKDYINSGKKSIRNSSKGYFTLLKSDIDITSNDSLVRYSIQEEILNLVTAYLKEAPYLYKIELILTEAKENNYNKIIKSQKWHKDYDDTKLLKFFTYLTDVESKDDGPFNLISKRLSNSLGLPLNPIHKNDQHFKNCKKVSIIGKKGKAFLVDTSKCFHMGSRIDKNKIRIMLVSTYTTFSPLLNKKNELKINNEYKQKTDYTFYN